MVACSRAEVLKFLYLPVLAVGIAFSPPAKGDPSPFAADTAVTLPTVSDTSVGALKSTAGEAPMTDRSLQADQSVAETSQSVLEKEDQAMTPAQLLERWGSFIKEASSRFNVPEAWIRAV